MQKGSKDTRVALVGCYLSSSPHAQRITVEWGNIHQTEMTVGVGKVRHFNGLSLNDSDGSRHPLLLCGCGIHNLCGGGYCWFELYVLTLRTCILLREPRTHTLRVF